MKQPVSSQKQISHSRTGTGTVDDFTTNSDDNNEFELCDDRMMIEDDLGMMMQEEPRGAPTFHR